MLEFHLFRLKVYFNEPFEFIDGPKDRAQLIYKSVNWLSAKGLSTGRVWHIGNLSPLDESSVYFRIGRTIVSTVELFHNGNFVDEEFETSPYTHGFLDYKLELCAIAKKPKLSPMVIGIARQFNRLMQLSDPFINSGSQIKIEEIKDPKSFIEQIRLSYRISRLSMTFGKPNSFDANEDFQKPMQKLLEAANGIDGKTVLKGESLDQNTVENIARAVASQGNDVSAWIQRRQGQPIERRDLKDNPALVKQEHVDDIENKKGLLDQIRLQYAKIRGINDTINNT